MDDDGLDILLSVALGGATGYFLARATSGVSSAAQGGMFNSAPGATTALPPPTSGGGSGGQTLLPPPSTAPATTLDGKIVTLRTSTGLTYQVNAKYAANFSGFVRALENTGYKITDIEGYDPRDIAGTNIPSFHAQGAAIDINPSQNPVGPANTNNLPSNIQALAKQFGLGWGGAWKSKKDPMHFSIAKSEGGSVALQHVILLA